MRNKKVHFIGIGGISMSGLAEILIANGCKVSGSDAVESDALARLRKAGAKIFVGNSPGNIGGDVDLVVYTAAIKEDNPERMAAVAKGLEVIDRAQLFKIIMKNYKKTVGVSGTHGKTTTTSFIADICLTAGLDPTIQIGGYMGGGEGFNSRVGGSEYFIMEACEYAGSFLQWAPHIGLILNVDNDHMDFFKSMDNLIGAFTQYAHSIPQDGFLIINAKTIGFEKITEGLKCSVVTFGDGGRFAVTDVTYNDYGHPAFSVTDGDKFFLRTEISMPGEYNMLNALAAAAACGALGIPPEKIAEGLASARGVKRRDEKKGVYNGALIVDNYAHHPSAVKACLTAARAKGRIIVLFQSHTYTRTANLLKEFGVSFKKADGVVLLPIYASREMFDNSISQHDLDCANKMLQKEIARNGVETFSVNNFSEAETYLRHELMPGDLLITMGAGEAHLVGEAMLRT